MANVYLTGLILFVVAYLAQSYVRSYAEPELMFAFGLYIMLISWSVVAESVVFATQFRSSTSERKAQQGIFGFLFGVLRDPVVFTTVGMIGVMYFHFRGEENEGWYGIVIVLLVVASFFLRIAESSAKSFAFRLGYHRQQQIIVNIFSMLKWIGAAIAVAVHSEIAIYSSIAIVSIASVYVLFRYCHSENITRREHASDSQSQRWVMLLATIVGVFSFQMDKMLAMNLNP